MKLDVAQAMGADDGVSVQTLMLYIPDRDQEGNAITDQRTWVMGAARLLATIGGGVTIMPPVDGGWVNRNGEIIWEKPVLVYTHIVPSKFTKAMPALRKFLHTMGRETRQGEVAFELDNRFYRIHKFDTARKSEAGGL